MGVFVFPDETTDNVLIRATFFDEAGSQTLASVTRVHADGGEHVVQEAITPLCDEIYVDDTTAPLNTTFHYVVHATPDDPAIVSADVTLAAEDDLIWIRDPNRPWANMQMSLCAVGTPCSPTAPDPCLTFIRWGTETYRADVELMPIFNRPRPADVYGRRKDAEVSSLRFLSTHGEGDCSCIENVRTLFTGGGPIHLTLPAAYCIPDRCYQPLDLVMSYLSDRIDQRKPWRMWEVPLVAVDCPTGPRQGVLDATWCDVNEDYATYADLTATGFFWGEVRSGNATAPPLLSGYGAGPYGSGPYGS